jgi:hypothetical protein
VVLTTAIALATALAVSGPALATPGQSPAMQESAAEDLETVAPAISCTQLATLDLAGTTGLPVSISSATETTATPGGWSACDVKGNIAPQEQFEACCR